MFKNKWRIAGIAFVYLSVLVALNVYLFNATQTPANSTNLGHLSAPRDTSAEVTYDDIADSREGAEPVDTAVNPAEAEVTQPTSNESTAGESVVAAEKSGAPEVTAEEVEMLGKEVAVVRHLQDGEEYTLPLAQLLAHGEALFKANWTIEEGAGRPLTTGTGRSLISPEKPLVFPRNFNRISGPDANSCAGCHNAPYGVAGGGGDIVANVFVLGQRFDFATFDSNDDVPISGAVDEKGNPVTMQTISNNRATLGMFGSGYIEMLARQMTADLQAIRNELQPGESRELLTKGVSFGVLSRNVEGYWDVSKVMGLPAPSITTTAPTAPPTLIIQPFHQAGGVISLRQFTNTAYNHHHGIQSSERFGVDVDKDGDGVANEMTRADVTAVTVFQAVMAVPGRVIPNNSVIEQAIWDGEQTFEQIGCAACHVSALPLDNAGWVFSEPNPYNLADNLRPGEAPEFSFDLTSAELPQPRLQPVDGVIWVPAYTDMKLHNITSGPDDPNCEPLNMHFNNRIEKFSQGNCRFLTKRLWGAANEPPYFHHGLFTTMREAILAHSGEALASRQAFEALSDYEKDAIIEFLKSLQVLPPGTQSLVIDEKGQPKEWPPRSE